MPLPPNLFCCPAGWSHPHWAGIVYPKTSPRAFHPLETLARYFDATEINASFHQPLRPEITQLWIRKVAHNPHFLFTVKLQRSFTHDRALGDREVGEFKEGLWPLMVRRKLGCVLMQFPWSFRYTEENRAFVIRLRRAFHEFPLVAEFRHSSWTREEALGMLIDYRVGFCNIDQAPFTKATPPTAHLTSEIGYIRLHGRNPQDWQPAAEGPAFARHNYLYNRAELDEWRGRIEHVAQFAAKTFVVANNESRGRSVINALQLSSMLGDERHIAPPELLQAYPEHLAEYTAERPVQRDLFVRAVA